MPPFCWDEPEAVGGSWAESAWPLGAGRRRRQARAPVPLGLAQGSTHDGCWQALDPRVVNRILPQMSRRDSALKEPAMPGGGPSHLLPHLLGGCDFDALNAGRGRTGQVQRLLSPVALGSTPSSQGCGAWQRITPHFTEETAGAWGAAASCSAREPERGEAGDRREATAQRAALCCGDCH